MTLCSFAWDSVPARRTEHLDTEEQILTAAVQPIPPALTEQAAQAAVAGTGLNAEQGEAVVRMLTASTMAATLIVPAGAGKSHTMAAFAGLWELLTGRRVIGLTISTGAARVLAGEGLAESYNIAEFLGKIEGSGELRRPVPVRAGEVLVIRVVSPSGTILRSTAALLCWHHPRLNRSRDVGVCLTS